MMKVLLSLLLLLTLPTTLLSQNTGKVTGTVFDNSSGNTMPYAHVRIESIQASTFTDINGKFTFNNIPQGRYTVKASFIGYKDYYHDFEIKGNQTKTIKIIMLDSLFAVEGVEIVSKRDNSLQQAYRVNIIPMQKIEAAPFQNINEILDFIPGVNVNSALGIFSGKIVVTMRGMPSNDQSRTLVVLDGVPLNKADEGSVNWNMINRNNIDQIRITKGPGPAMYGSGAMGGIIEMTSKKPSHLLEGYGIVEYGSYNTLYSGTSLSGKLSGKLSPHEIFWGINATGRFSDGYISVPSRYRTEGDTILEPVFVKEFNASARLGYSYMKKHQAWLRFSFFDDMRGSGYKVFEDYGGNTMHYTYNGAAAYEGLIGSWKINFNFFMTRENYKRLYEYMNEGEYKLYAADSWRGDLGAGLSAAYQGIRKQIITTGLSYKRGSVSGKDTYFTSTDIISNAGKMDVYALYLQDELKFLSDKLQLNIGLRLDMAAFHHGLFSIEYPSYSIAFYSEFNDTVMSRKFWYALCPRFSAQYRFNESTRIYIAAGRGFTAPILDNMCRTGKRQGTFSIANPALKPELLTTAEAGADIEIIRGLSISASLYYSIGKDFMYYVSTGDSVNMGYTIAPVIQKRNIGKVEIYGCETEIKYELKEKLSVFANYTYTHSVIREHHINNPAVDVNLTDKFLTNMPNHKAGAGATWKNKIVNTTLLLKYIGKTWLNDQNIPDIENLLPSRLDDYMIFSSRLERQIFKGLSVAFNVENIFNKKYITGDIQECPGRIFTGSIKYVFN